MEARLFQAACTGNLDVLHDCVGEDAAILQKLQSWGTYADTPLHLASMFGHTDFMREYMTLSSISLQQLCQLNRDGYSPLHLASVNGHLEIVQHLLEIGKPGEHLCKKKDKNGRVAIHCAAISGRTDVIDVLQVNCPEAVMELTTDQESVLHLMMKHHQYDAFEFLIEALGSSAGGLLNLGDREGNTVLHMATANRQLRTVEYLVKQVELDVNAVNSYGLTALDVMFVSTSFNMNDVYIEETLRLAGGSRSRMRTTNVQTAPAHHHSDEESRNEVNEWFKEMRSAIIVMASLVATLAFQVALTPPGGMWQDWDPNATEQKPGKSILYDLAPNKYSILMYFNSQTFLASIATIVALLRPFRARRWILVQFAVYITVVSITVKFYLILSLTTKWKVLEQPASVLVILIWGAFLFVSLFGFYLGTEFHLHKSFPKCKLVCFMRKLFQLN